MILSVCFFFFKQKTAYEMRISDWSSDVCSSDLDQVLAGAVHHLEHGGVGEQRPQGVGDALGEWIDQQDVVVAVAVAERYLHQGQLRPVGAFADEFGVQADAAGVLSDAEFQFRGVFDPVGHGVMVEWQWRSLPGESGQRDRKSKR